MTFTAKSPIEKLSLVARKSIRDNFEVKHPEYNEKISAIMGEPWTTEVNANEVYPYATSGGALSDPGSCFSGYFEPFIKNLTSFTQQYGADGKAELNSAVSSHKVILAVDDTGKQNYCGSDIKDGILRLVFHADKLGMFPSDASNDLVGTLKAAPAPAGTMNLITRNGIKKDYEAGVEGVRAELAKMLAMPALKLTPNFEHNYAELSKEGSGASTGWDEKLGKSTLGYFEGVQKNLKRQKYDLDDMLQEGFQEAVHKGEITIKIVEKLASGGSYNEVVINDGVLVIQTLPSQWGSWLGDPANNLTDML